VSYNLPSEPSSNIQVTWHVDKCIPKWWIWLGISALSVWRSFQTWRQQDNVPRMRFEHPALSVVQLFASVFLFIGIILPTWSNESHFFESDFYYTYTSRDSSVGIATDYGLDDRGIAVRVPVWSRIFSSPRRPDRLWGPPTLLSNSSGGKAGGA
jgi:hypothetical protein